LSGKPYLYPGKIEKESSRIDLLEAEILRLKNRDKINRTLLEISNAVTTTLNLDDLYEIIYQSLNRLIKTTNFYISIYDREKQLLNFPYYQDEQDGTNNDAIVLFEENSLTGEVILNEKPLFMDEVSLLQRYRENRVMGSLPKIWIGVPLIARGIVIIVQDKAIGRYFSDLFPEFSALTRNIHTAVKDQKVVEKNKIRQQISNDIRYMNITVYPLTGGENQGAVIRMDDVTEQVKIDNMMVQSEKMLSVGGLAAGMAHEINNPLAGMMQNAQIILHRLTKKIPGNMEAAQKAGVNLDNMRSYMEARNIFRQFEHINTAGSRAAKIVSNMLSFAQKGEGRKSYENLVLIMENTILLAKNEYHLKRKLDVKQLSIKIEKPGEFPQVACEGSKIQQVFLNIIKNGTEAMIDANAMDCPDHTKPEFLIRFSVETDMVKVEITDNGPGMEKKVQEKIFEPFFTTKPPGKGTGLGLSVSYFIVAEDHKGELRVVSSPIKLPIHG